MSPSNNSADPLNPGDDAEEAFWQSVYAAREKFYREHIGELPEDILKLGHMFGVWPGGGLFVIPATALGEDIWVSTTFGFTNPDMPASTAACDVDVEHDEQGRVIRSSARLESRDRATAPDGAAGYGYEMIVLTRGQAEWPLWFLQWTANAEILNDVGILERVETYDGLTVEQIKIGQEETANFLIAKAQPPLPPGIMLPNGKMTLLTATMITNDEMQWSMENGRTPLLDKLQSSGVGQFSIRERKSVLR